MRQELRIVGVEVHKNDVKVIRRKKRNRPTSNKAIWFYDAEGNLCINRGINKSEIYEFSRRSEKTMAFILSNTECEFDRMITLTYPGEFTNDGKVVKKHLRALLQWLRRRNVEAYFWFLEFQGRGAPHFHVLMQGGDYIDRLDISHRWFEIVGSGDINHYLAGTRLDIPKKQRGLHFYGIKYAQKRSQKAVPPDYRNVGRLWGCSTNVNPKEPLFIPVDSEKALSSLVKEWEYAGAEKEGYTILYNASDAVVSLLLEAGYFQSKE